MSKLAGLTLLLVGVAGVMSAVPPPIPEIDPSSGVSAVAMIAGALLIVRGRRKK